jgi:hypothetical protein
MNEVTRRSDQTPVATTGEQLPVRTHHIESIFVSSQLTLAMEPRLRFAWTVKPAYWYAGYTLMVFRSTAGFCPQKYPKDLNEHGRLIIETDRDAYHDECPEEGTHFFTFVLHKRILLGLSERLSVLRFSETIPSARVVVGRIRDQIELRELGVRHEVGLIEHEAKVNEAEIRRIHSRRKLDEVNNPVPKKPPSAAAAILAGELDGIDAMVDTAYARKQKLKEIKSNTRFKTLSRGERKAILKIIEERLDAAEISARSEQ